MRLDFTERDLEELIELNRLRGIEASREQGLLEARFNTEYGADCRLAVYGTLAPGRANHHHLSSMEGSWVSGLTVRGEFVRKGWGADLGYPALRWSVSWAPVPVELFISDQLTNHWPRLDRFEGQEYRRILVPLFDATAVVAVANLYATPA